MRWAKKVNFVHCPKFTVCCSGKQGWDKHNRWDTWDKAPAGFSPKAAKQAVPVGLALATCGFSGEAALLTSKLLFLVPFHTELRDSLYELWERRTTISAVGFTDFQASAHSLHFNIADGNIMAGCEYIMSFPFPHLYFGKHYYCNEELRDRRVCWVQRPSIKMWIFCIIQCNSKRTVFLNSGNNRYVL